MWVGLIPLVEGLKKKIELPGERVNSPSRLSLDSNCKINSFLGL